jgi:hypothetical protein
MIHQPTAKMSSPCASENYVDEIRNGAIFESLFKQKNVANILFKGLFVTVFANPFSLKETENKVLVNL